MAESFPELKALLVDEMEGLLHAENQQTKLLAKLAKAAHSPQLRQSFTDHLEQTRGHSERLQQALTLLGVKGKAQLNKGMHGLIEEAEESASAAKELEAAAADLALIITAQKLKHYEIAGYGSLRALADRIGEARVARLMGDNLAEERHLDERLTQVAEPLFAKAA